MSLLDYSGYACGVRGLGPGRRVVLWVRGCGIGCPGCMTEELWAPGEGRPVDRLVEELVPLLREADGLSISGGEPFDQAPGLVALVHGIRRGVDAHVLVYSGYRYERLLEREDARALLAVLDMLIDGPYVEGASNELVWRGSDNQRLMLLSERAQAEAVDERMPEDRELQLQPLPNGGVRLIGIPRRGDLERLSAALAARGFRLGAGV